MAVTETIGLFTQALNAAFVNGYDIVAEPAPIDPAITLVDSKGKVENYPWMFPPPMLAVWNGFRAYSKLGTTNYRVPNITYSAGFEVEFEDLEDDQIGGFKLQAAAMGEGAQEWRGIACLQNLALGQTTNSFDNNYYFASRTSGVSGAVGTGNNIVTATTVSTDGLTHAMVVMFTKRKVKPLLWQIREIEGLETDFGSIEAKKTRKVKWWTTLRGAPAFGYWFDSVLVKFANTPTLAEIQTALGQAKAQFRTFTYPKNQGSDPNQYPHGQTKFNTDTTLIVCSSKIEHLVNQALTLSLISTTENPYRDMAQLVCSGYLDSLV